MSDTAGRARWEEDCPAADCTRYVKITASTGPAARDAAREWMDKHVSDCEHVQSEVDRLSPSMFSSSA